MFAAPQAPNLRQRSTSHSTDDHSSTKGRPRKLFQRYAHDLTMSSQSLAISSSSSHHDDLPTPSAPTLALHTSAHSTPMTSPSTAYSSLFPGSLSSATSESAPSAEYRSEFGLLMSGSSAYSPVYGSTSSRSSQPVSPRSNSTTESDALPSPPQMPCKSPSPSSSHRPSTVPHSPLLATPSIAADAPAEHHTRSHSKLTASIKSFLSRPSISSPSRFSFNSSTVPSENDSSFRSFQIPAVTGKWSMTPRKSRPPNLEISVAAAAMITPNRASSPLTDAHHQYASEAAAKIHHTRTGNYHPTSQESLDLLIQNVPPVPARGREPKTRNVLRRRPSGSSKLFKARERDTSSPSCPHGVDADLLLKAGTSHLIEAPFPLTPAGAVVEAYKQQELHRDDMPSPPKLSIGDRVNARASHDGGYGREHPGKSPTAYYTVFGSSSEHRVKVGGPDDRLGRFEADQLTWNTSRATLLYQPSTSDPSSRSLARRISSKWRKVKGGDVMSEEPPARDRGHSKGRRSLQEISSDKSGTRSTGRSMDSVPSMGDGAWSSPSASHARSGSDKDGRKIWRLMRRISTGGLRDRFQSEKVVPPVPAIPKELLMKANQGERSNERVSMLHHKPSSSLHDKERILPFKSIPSAPPSSVIASSSNLSDVPSTQFFQKARSARSSVSSYGEAMVTSRSPEIALDQRIIAPVEQLRLDEDYAGSGKTGASSVPVSQSPRRRSASVPAGLRTVEDVESEHVPLPSSHRQTYSGDSPSCASSRASSTSTPASGSGVRQSRTMDGIVSLSPPPRPMRNSPRGGSMVSSPPYSMLVKQMDGGGGIGIVGARQLDRMPSGQSDMTARAESSGPGRLRDEDASSHARTGFTFRELSAPRRPPLTEREKVDIWNDLLDRSDKAGGTLHINGAAELMSDSLRFSMHSEI